MPRYINGLLNLARSGIKLRHVGFEVKNRETIINKNFFSCNALNRQQIDSNKNNDSVETSDGVIADVKNIIDENYEWTDVPADKVKLPHALDICHDDISHIAQYTKPTFNFAAYANTSPMIQELIKLGVELWRLESNPKAMECILQRNFDDMKPYIQFLHDCGVPAESIGYSITKYPLIFNEDLDDLHTRIRYLRAHNFTRNDIATIVTRNPVWLKYTTIQIDERLAYFQREFKLTGNETRVVAVTQPTLITYKASVVVENTFCIREEMGFENNQVKMILLKRPRVWMQGRDRLVEVFDYAHNVMKLSHEIIAHLPTILITRIEIVKNRHEYLKSLNRVQYDPTKPLYVSPDNIAYGNDYMFCTNIAKTSIELYDMFLKTR